MQSDHGSDSKETGMVLVVEDSRALRGLLASYLNDWYGLAVVGVGSLAETEAQLAGCPERFFCAVLNLNLPDAPNGGVVDLVRSRGIPAIVLTGFVDPALRETMLAKQVLKAIAATLNKTLRASDIIGRYGGEEFVCLTVLQAETDAERVFERVCAAVAKIGLSAGGQPVPLTVSIGFTTDLGNSLKQMIEQADSAVYRAKAEGRNRAVRWSLQSSAG